MLRKLFTIAVLLSSALLAASPADAFWHHWRGYGWGGGYGGCGYGGCGYGGCGYGGWGCAPACGGCYCGGSAGGGYNGFGYGAWGASPFIRPYITLAPAYPPLVAIPSIRPPVATAQPSAAVSLSKSDLARVLSRVSNVEARRKAERSLAEGDELFRAQNYHSALQRYKLAASTAPDLAQPQWRKGHALVATHNYDLAIAAFKRALELSPDGKRGAPKLDELYGAAAMTKTLHLESLAEWALGRTESSDAWFLVGITLYFDGQSDRAEKCFARATELDASSARSLAALRAPHPPVPATVKSVPAPARLTSIATEL